MTAFDLIAFGIVFVCAAISAMRGLVGELVSFAGWIAALAAARIGAVDAADTLFPDMQPREIALLCGFVAVYVAARLLIAFLAQMLESAAGKVRLSTLNRLLGAVIGSLKGVIVVSIGVLLLSFGSLPQNEEWRNAASAPFFETLAGLGKPYLPEFLAKQSHLGSDMGLPDAAPAALTDPVSGRLKDADAVSAPHRPAGGSRSGSLKKPSSPKSPKPASE
nr:CvpA family protein [uncultured Kingella sp.]